MKRDFVLDEFAPYRIVALGHAISGRLAQRLSRREHHHPGMARACGDRQAREVAARDVVSRTPMDKMTV